MIVPLRLIENGPAGMIPQIGIGAVLKQMAHDRDRRTAARHEVQRRLPAVVLPVQVDAGMFRKDPVDRQRRTHLRQVHEADVAVVVPEVGIRAILQQHPDRLCLFSGCGKMKRGMPVAVLLLDGHAQLEQRFDHFGVSEPGGDVERRIPVLRIGPGQRITRGVEHLKQLRILPVLHDIVGELAGIVLMRLVTIAEADHLHRHLRPVHLAGDRERAQNPPPAAAVLLRRTVQPPAGVKIDQKLPFLSGKRFFADDLLQLPEGFRVSLSGEQAAFQRAQRFGELPGEEFQPQHLVVEPGGADLFGEEAAPLPAAAFDELLRAAVLLQRGGGVIVTQFRHLAAETVEEEVVPPGGSSRPFAVLVEQPVGTLPDPRIEIDLLPADTGIVPGDLGEALIPHRRDLQLPPGAVHRLDGKLTDQLVRAAPARQDSPQDLAESRAVLGIEPDQLLECLDHRRLIGLPHLHGDQLDVGVHPLRMELQCGVKVVPGRAQILVESLPPLLRHGTGPAAAPALPRPGDGGAPPHHFMEPRIDLVAEGLHAGFQLSPVAGTAVAFGGEVIVEPLVAAAAAPLSGKDGGLDLRDDPAVEPLVLRRVAAPAAPAELQQQNPAQKRSRQNPGQPRQRLPRRIELAGAVEPGDARSLRPRGGEGGGFHLLRLERRLVAAIEVGEEGADIGVIARGKLLQEKLFIGIDPPFPLLGGGPAVLPVAVESGEGVVSLRKRILLRRRQLRKLLLREEASPHRHIDAAEEVAEFGFRRAAETVPENRLHLGILPTQREQRPVGGKGGEVDVLLLPFRDPGEGEIQDIEDILLLPGGEVRAPGKIGIDGGEFPDLFH